MLPWIQGSKGIPADSPAVGVGQTLYLDPWSAQGRRINHNMDKDGILSFGVFALRDLKVNEEVVPGWEWDDGSAKHHLPAAIQSQHLFKYDHDRREEPNFLRKQLSVILHTTFTTYRPVNGKKKNKNDVRTRDLDVSGPIFSIVADTLPPPAPRNSNFRNRRSELQRDALENAHQRSFMSGLRSYDELAIQNTEHDISPPSMLPPRPPEDEDTDNGHMDVDRGYVEEDQGRVAWEGGRPWAGFVHALLFELNNDAVFWAKWGGHAPTMAYASSTYASFVGSNYGLLDPTTTTTHISISTTKP
ncbi:hypothetical protein ONZ45_g11479 [Pleurotus djamor]|nr:hypothetical protein ONZ45_g11479 [Pleurotus djamor]